jgi:shikimate 5-dehydrogenase
MQPHEIKPDTALCTIIGFNAQTSPQRVYFNKILKRYGINATAIALNIKEEHFQNVMASVKGSKVNRMIILPEFQLRAPDMCDMLDESARLHERVDYIEIEEGVIKGFSLEISLAKLFENAHYADDLERLLGRMLLIAHKWYDVPCQIDEIPFLIEKS